MFYKMRWAHLPWPGALSDQHPEWVDAMQFIMAENDKAEKARQEKQERESKSKKK